MRSLIYGYGDTGKSFERYLKDKKIPLILLNARITKKTFNRWSKISFFSKLIFGMITVAYPQNLETEYFLSKRFAILLSNILE